MSEQTIQPELLLVSPVKAWKAVIAAMVDVDVEIQLKITDAGLVFDAMDSAHHFKIKFTWPKDKFSKYEYHNIDKISFQATELIPLLKRLSDTEDVAVTWDRANLVFSTSKKEFQIRLIEPSLHEVPEIKVDFNTKFTIPTAEFKSILDDMKISSKYITMDSLDHKVIFSAKEEMGAKKSTVVYESEIDLVASHVEFSAEFLNIINDIKLYSEKMVMEFGNKQPIRITFNVPDVAEIQYYMAPRTEN